MRISNIHLSARNVLAGFWHTAALALLVVASSACQKVIEVDLKDTNEALVIEAEVSDQEMVPHRVRLSKVINYNQPNVFPQVSGAKVTLSDNAGNSVLLSEEIPGIYITSAITGIPGRTYTVVVQAEGKEYRASATMPLPVAIDSLIQRDVRFGPVASKAVRVYYQDPEQAGNFYRLLQRKGNKTDNSIYIAEDRLNNGQQFSATLLNRDASFSLKANDTVQVQLQSIDKRVYEYFRTLSEALSNGGANSASPANPVSNFDNGAMGYFNAYSATSRSLVIE